MSLRSSGVGEVPAQTARVARLAFPKGCLAMRVRDELGALFADEQFVDLFAVRGRPAVSPWRLALVSVLQFVEALSDRQAAQAVRARIDWKYLLGLELTDEGFDASVLCEFRDRLVRGGVSRDRLLRLLLERLAAAGLVKSGGRARTDSTHVLAAVRNLNRVELVGELPVELLGRLRWRPVLRLPLPARRSAATSSSTPPRTGVRVEQASHMARTAAHDDHRDDPLRHGDRDQLEPATSTADPPRLLGRPRRRAAGHRRHPHPPAARAPTR